MTAPALLILFAAAAQVSITLYAIAAMGMARVRFLKSGALKLADIALDDTRWPDEIRQLQNNVRNQFETPMLFFAGIAIALALDEASWAVAMFAWAYVVCRVVHRMIHVGSNDVRKRFNAFGAGLLALLGLWISLLIGTAI